MKRKIGTREWSDQSYNCCDGCSNDCVYCYARHAAIKRGTTTRLRWHIEKPDAMKTGAEVSKEKGVVMFPTQHDITERNWKLVLRALVNMLSNGNRVLLVSKPRFSVMERFIGCLMGNHHEISDKELDRIEFRFSIGCMDTKIQDIWEPGATSYSERMDVLRWVHGHNLETSVSCEPLLEPERIMDMLEEMAPFVTRGVWIGKLNRLEERVDPSEVPEKEMQRLNNQQTDEMVQTVYDKIMLSKHRSIVRWKDSYKEVLGLP